MKVHSGDNESTLSWFGGGSSAGDAYLPVASGNGEHGKYAPYDDVLNPGTVAEVGKTLTFTTDLVFLESHSVTPDHYVYFQTHQYAVGAPIPNNPTTFPLLLNWADLTLPRSVYNEFLKYARLAITDITLWRAEGFYDYGDGVPRPPVEGNTWGVSPAGTYQIDIGPIVKTTGAMGPPIATYASFSFADNVFPVSRGLVVPFSTMYGIPNPAPYLMGRWNTDTADSNGALLALSLKNIGLGAISAPSGYNPPWRFRVVMRGYIC